MNIVLNVNDRNYEFIASPDEKLIDSLRKLGFKSVKRGCESTSCGLCSVWADEKVILSCSVFAAEMQNKKITTLEGLKDEAEVFASFFAKEGAEQCGYCSPGFIMGVLAMKKQLKKPSDKEIKAFLNGNLCRCSGYEGQLRAIKKYLEV